MNPKTLRITLFALNLIFGFILIISIPDLLFVPMLFDAPGSKSSPLTVSLALAVGSYPILFTIAYKLGWKLFEQGAPAVRVLVVALLPLVGIGWYVTTTVLLKTLCHDQFVCQTPWK